MFKYNELSDLNNSSLVTPLSKTDDGSIRCIDSEGNECYYEFDDFDFDKTVEEREASLEDQLEDSTETEETEDSTETEDTTSTITVSELIAAMEQDDSANDGTDSEEEIIEEDDTEEEEEKSGWVTDEDEKKTVLDNIGYAEDAKTCYKIWRDII